MERSATLRGEWETRLSRFRFVTYLKASAFFLCIGGGGTQRARTWVLEEERVGIYPVQREGTLTRG